MRIPYRYAMAAFLLAASATACSQETSAPPAEANPAPEQPAPATPEPAQQTQAKPEPAKAPPPQKAPAEEPKTGIVVTSEDASSRCILPLVVTAVDGTAVAEGQPSDRFEFEPGEHTFAGYGAGDPSQCATFAAEGGLPIPEGGRIGEGTLQLNVEAGKEYYLGVDVRSKDESRWKVVAWKIKH